MSKNTKGLKFTYIINGKEYKYHCNTIDDFISTSFPINNNPLSPMLDTTIKNIKWKNNHFCTNDINTVSKLLKLLLDNPNVIYENLRQNKKIQPRYIQKEKYKIDEIKEKTQEMLFNPKWVKSKILLDGDLVKANSQRFQVFFTKGTKCACCGIEGQFFRKEKLKNDQSFHLNLYALDDDGNEVLMTKDHIIPKSKGGRDTLENYQPMCEHCNKEKGNKI